MGLRAEIQTRQRHRQAPYPAAAKCEGSEIAAVDTVFVESIGSGAAQTALMKNVVTQNDLGTRICAGPFEFAAGESAFAAQIYFSRRGHGRAQYFAEIHEIRPAAVTVFPLRGLEVGHLRLQVESRSSDNKLTLFDGEAVMPKREFRRGADRQRKKALDRKSTRLNS